MKMNINEAIAFTNNGRTKTKVIIQINVTEILVRKISIPENK